MDDKFYDSEKDIETDKAFDKFIEERLAEETVPFEEAMRFNMTLSFWQTGHPLPEGEQRVNIIEQLRQELLENADEATKQSGQRFFKEDVKLYGVKTALVTKLSKKAFKIIKDLPKKDIFDLCEQLWKSGMLEESGIACNWSYAVHQQYTENDFLIFERWVNEYVTNWASCDTLGNHTIGTFLEMFPAYIEKLKEWTQSENRWVRRASAVSLIIPAKKGLFKADI